jgi:prepilin signal peptidase PulO-like enzyme (type II secretory pathway)
VGSFLNCLIFRLEKNQGFFGRSFCPHCQQKLSFKDLIPLLSFLLLKGKCRYCQKKISLQYPLVELATGILFFLIFWHLKFKFDLTFGFWILDLLCYLTITSFLIVIFVYDLKHYLIPGKIIYPALSLTLFNQLFKIWNFGHWNLFEIWNLLFAVLPAFFFLAIILISSGYWMGLGDFKLAILMGLFLGFPKILVALFLAFLIGAIIGVALIISGKRTLKSQIPFGPFLVLGTFLALFFGKKIIDCYLNLFYY